MSKQNLVSIILIVLIASLLFIGNTQVGLAAGATSQLKVAAPSAVYSGVQFQFNVTAQNSTGAADTTYNNTVHFTSNDAPPFYPLTLI